MTTQSIDTPTDHNSVYYIITRLCRAGFTTPASQILGIVDFELRQSRLGLKKNYFEGNGLFQYFFESILDFEDRVLASEYGEIWHAFENLYFCGYIGGDFYYPGWQSIVSKSSVIERQNHFFYSFKLRQELQVLWQHHAPLAKRQPRSFYKSLDQVMNCGVLYIYYKAVATTDSSMPYTRHPLCS
jgi:hypothetical protein